MFLTARVLAIASALFSVAPAQQLYGNPTPGSGGFTPRLTAFGARLGEAGFRFEIQGGLGGALAWIVIGTDAGNQTVAGFDLLVDPAGYQGALPTALGGTLPGDGEQVVALSLASLTSPALIGTAFHAQAIIVDAGAPSGGLAASQGVRFELGLPSQIIVGASIGANGPLYLIDPATNSLIGNATPPQIGNAYGAAFGSGGQSLFVATTLPGAATGGTTTGGIVFANLQPGPVVWSTVFSSPGRCQGAFMDSRRNWLWTSADLGSGSSELVAIDADPSSTQFGQITANTASLQIGIIESLTDISPSRRRAAILRVGGVGLLSRLSIVDLDDTSPTFLTQLTNRIDIPINRPTSLPLVVAVRITPDDRYALALISNGGSSQIARLDLDTGTWVDHDPSTPTIDNIGTLSQPPLPLPDGSSDFVLSQTGSFAILAGIGQCGWTGRLELDPFDPQSFAWNPFPPRAMEYLMRLALSPDESEFAIPMFDLSGCTTSARSRLERFDANTGAWLGTTNLGQFPGARNLYTIAYR